MRSQLRQRWRSWCGLAILAGLFAGTALALTAGAHRTETSYARFLATTRPFDVLVPNGGTTPDNLNAQFDFREVRQLPLVADAAPLQYYFPSGTTSKGAPVTSSDLFTFASADRRFGTELNRFEVLEGRLPRDEHEIAITPASAELLGVDVGQTVRLGLGGVDSFVRSEAPREEPFGVVGEVAMQGGFPPATSGLPAPVVVSHRYARAHPDAAEVLAVRLRDGVADIPAFERALSRLANDERIVTTSRTELTIVERGLEVQATVLRLGALLFVVAGLLVLGPVFVREAEARSRDDRMLRTLGMTGAQLASLRVTFALLVGAAATLLAFATALLATPLTAVGLARVLDPHRGLQLNAGVLAGVVGVFVVVTVLAIGAAWLSARRPAHTAPAPTNRRVARTGRLAARLSLSPARNVGVHMALGGEPDRRAAPIVTTIVGLVLGLALICAVLTFSAGVNRLFDNPRFYGWGWDVQIGDAYEPVEPEEVAQLVRDPGSDGVAVGTMQRIDVDGRLVDALAFDTVKGGLAPVVLDGRAPTSAREVMLGTRVLRQLGRSVGDRVRLELGGRSKPFVVVGRGVLAEFPGGARLGDGAALTLEGIRRLRADAEPDLALVRVRSGDDGDALVDELRRAHTGDSYLPIEPSDLTDLGRRGGLLWFVVIALALAVFTTLVVALVTSVRHLRRELAILRVLGFARRELSTCIRWQAVVTASLAACLGVPLGLALGRFSWTLFAARLGVSPRPATPLVALAIVAVGTLALGALTSIVPARLAARMRASEVLRNE